MGRGLEANKFLRESLIKIGEASFIRRIAESPLTPLAVDAVGLGALAVPHIAHKMGKKPSDETIANLELGGLGAIGGSVGLHAYQLMKGLHK